MKANTKPTTQNIDVFTCFAYKFEVDVDCYWQNEERVIGVINLQCKPPVLTKKRIKRFRLPVGRFEWKKVTKIKYTSVIDKLRKIIQ